MKTSRSRISTALAIMLGVSVAVSQPQRTIHPEAQVFRAGAHAYIIGPASPIDILGFVLSVSVAPGSSGWALITHRRRVDLDSATTLPASVDFGRSYSLFNMVTGEWRPLDRIPFADAPAIRIIHGAGNVVIFGTMGAVNVSQRVSQQAAYYGQTGQFIPLPDNVDAWVLDDKRLLIQWEDRLTILSENGERTPVTPEGTKYNVTLTSNPSQFLLSHVVGSRDVQWSLFDATSNRITAISQEEALAMDLRNVRPLRVVQEPDPYAADTFTAWIDRADSKTPRILSNSFLTPGILGGKLPHEVDSSVRLAAELARTNTFALGGLTFDAQNQPSAAWFVRNHQLFTRSFEMMSLADYEAHVRQAVQEAAMNRAKTVATAIMIYCSDYDGATPANPKWQDAVKPYLRDAASMNGIVYLGDGKPLSEIENPSTTFMGFLDTPYGRVNMAWDGSARWVPKVTP
jgi:hypothetical protein